MRCNYGRITVGSIKVERRSNLYNDRPRLIMANEILSGGVLLSAMQKNDSCAISSSFSLYDA